MLMDILLRIPGLKRRLGLMPIVDLIPVVGDISTGLVSASLLLYGLRRGLPKILLARMALNVVVNELVGAVPILGSAFAFWFRPNERNYLLLQRHIDTPVHPRKSDWIFVLAIIGAVVLVIIGGLVTSWWLLYQFFKLLGVH
jgi:hypothetical protein